MYVTNMPLHNIIIHLQAYATREMCVCQVSQSSELKYSDVVLT